MGTLFESDLFGIAANAFKRKYPGNHFIPTRRLTYSGWKIF
jgi:hypothetical protein